jgi:uncharacterized protein DUF6468
MDMILSNVSDILLITATLGAGIFCLILSRRLTRLSRIDNGLGGAIAVLSAQVDDMSKALAETKSGSEGSATRLEELNADARTLLEELELMLSACHDVGEAPPTATDATDALWQEKAIPEPEPEAEPVIMFGSRRHAAKDTQEGPVPMFLKSKSRLAGQG